MRRRPWIEWRNLRSDLAILEDGVEDELADRHACLLFDVEGASVPDFKLKRAAGVGVVVFLKVDARSTIRNLFGPLEGRNHRRAFSFSKAIVIGPIER